MIEDLPEEIKFNLAMQKELAKPFYEAKEKGICPYAKLNVTSDGKVKMAAITIGRFRLYFHATNLNGHKINIIERKCQCNGCNEQTFYIPFDGTESGEYEQPFIFNSII